MVKLFFWLCPRTSLFVPTLISLVSLQKMSEKGKKNVSAVDTLTFYIGEKSYVLLSRLLLAILAGSSTFCLLSCSGSIRSIWSFWSVECSGC